MKITRRQIRKMINEAFEIPDRRRGFMGMGFGGGYNRYDPYAKHRLHEDESEDQAFAIDAWAGGDNLANPIDNLEADTGLENVTEPETLDLTTERRIRAAVRRILLRAGK